MRTKLILGALAMAGCVGGDDTGDLNVDEAALCVVSFGGHEVCDGEDNDCDGYKDESCGPVDIASLPIAGCHTAYAAAVTTTGSLIAATPSAGLLNTLDVVAPSGAIQSATASTSSMNIAALYRASGRVFMLTSQYAIPGTPTLVIQAVSSDGVPTAPLAQGSLPGADLGFGVDAAGRFFVLGGDWKVRRWDGVAFVPWTTAVAFHHSLLAAAPDGQSVYTHGGYGWTGEIEHSEELWKVTAKASTTIDDNLFLADGRALSLTALYTDPLGRIYVSGMCTMAQDCAAVLRYDAQGKHRVLVALSAEARAAALGIDPIANALVLYREFDGCGSPTQFGIVRLPL